MKLNVEVDGEKYVLNFDRDSADAQYSLSGSANSAGRASIIEVMPGVFSILLGARSFSVHVSERDGVLEVWNAGRRSTVSLSDPRDSTSADKKLPFDGPTELRAQMPGKIIKLLVAPGEQVEAGQGVVIVEAMKMQNEMKSSKAGRASVIRVKEGATVTAGEVLLVID